ncbi:MAG: polyprenyl synthetase family protein [Alphaproteobacteria bacterium]|nr:polyprenyl synthetase family protein [Alphaproteobacteria bacterium]
MAVALPKLQENTHPLDRLHDLLSDDMNAVNSMILARMNSPVTLIPQLAGYLVAAGGKRIRPLLTLASAKLCGADMARAHRLATAVEFIHSATLLHDDVVDESHERRGQKSANVVFGNTASVLVGDFLFSRAFQLMVEDGSLTTLKILSDASAIIAEGEVLQLSTQNNLKTTMDDYLKVIEGKTASLFSAACEVGPVIAGSPASYQDALRAYGLSLGMAFQIVDDVLDYNAEREKLGKTVGDDFREGKITAPILMALEKATSSELDFWKRTLQDKEQSDQDLRQAQDFLRQHGAYDRGLALAKNYGMRALESLNILPSGALTSSLADLVTFTLNRSH